MATAQRLRELMYANIKKECKMFEELSGNVTTRIATEEELKKYCNIKFKNRERLYKELNRKEM